MGQKFEGSSCPPQRLGRFGDRNVHNPAVTGSNRKSRPRNLSRATRCGAILVASRGGLGPKLSLVSVSRAACYRRLRALFRSQLANRACELCRDRCPTGTGSRESIEVDVRTVDTFNSIFRSAHLSSSLSQIRDLALHLASFLLADSGAGPP